jgi:hypothetical protein
MDGASRRPRTLHAIQRIRVIPRSRDLEAGPRPTACPKTTVSRSIKVSTSRVDSAVMRYHDTDVATAQQAPPSCRMVGRW